MIITDLKTIKEIQQEFNKKFPFLKIEFYKEAHSAKEGSPNSIKWDSENTIEAIRKIHTSGNFSIQQDQKTSTLEANFVEEYGLNVQVFYKSGDLWLQTMATDEWTLKQQNDRAESFTKFQENKI
jgi:hypothetical protein|tara:strand:+ start:408 stop:782 length:375 start_codon:yes stop_codon:yes gene_type:complete